MSSNKVYRFTRTSGLNHQEFFPGTLQAISVQANQVDLTDIGAMFDEYRIMSATASWWPDITTVECSSAIAVATPVDPGMFELVVDYDDANAPLATDLYENQTYRRVRFVGSGNKPAITSTIVPRASRAFFKTVLTTGFGSVSRPWLDLANSDVPHYGWKYHFSSSIPDVEHNFGYYFQIVLELEVRGVR